MKRKGRQARDAADEHPSRPSLHEHVARNVQAVTEIHTQAEHVLTRHQRAIEAMTGLFGRPASLYAIVVAVGAWLAGNLVCTSLGLWAPDPPPFPMLQGVVGLAALLVTTMVLITQNRQAKLSERRMHLDLQVNLLTEQKTAKLIELLEELRRDLPNVRNRRDVEAEVLQRAAEPLKVLAALDEHVEAVLEAAAQAETAQ